MRILSSFAAIVGGVHELCAINVYRGIDMNKTMGVLLSLSAKLLA